MGCGPPEPYYPASALDRRPYPLAHIDPPYPGGSDGAQYYGKLRMTLYLSARGEVDRIEVVEASLPPAYRDVAVEAFARSRWEPGVKGGKKVPSVKEIEVRYEPPVRVERPPIAPES